MDRHAAGRPQSPVAFANEQVSEAYATAYFWEQEELKREAAEREAVKAKIVAECERILALVDEHYTVSQATTRAHGKRFREMARRINVAFTEAGQAGNQRREPTMAEAIGTGMW